MSKLPLLRLASEWIMFCLIFFTGLPHAWALITYQNQTYTTNQSVTLTDNTEWINCTFNHANLTITMSGSYTAKISGCLFNKGRIYVTGGTTSTANDALRIELTNIYFPPQSAIAVSISDGKFYINNVSIRGPTENSNKATVHGIRIGAAPEGGVISQFTMINTTGSAILIEEDTTINSIAINSGSFIGCNGGLWLLNTTDGAMSCSVSDIYSINSNYNSVPTNRQAGLVAPCLRDEFYNGTSYLRGDTTFTNYTCVNTERGIWIGQ